MRTFTFRQMAAAALVSAAAGMMAGRACQPLSEGIARAGPAQSCESLNESPPVQLLGVIAGRAVRENAAPIRRDLGASPSEEVTLDFYFHVEETGRVRVQDVLATCGASRCRTDGELPMMIGILLSEEWTVGDGGRECDIYMSLKVPPAGSYRLPFVPQSGRGIDL
ncbi:MAG: hypothetical protein AB1529_01335 [Candidatus Micrarchaeota archaeon]